MLLRFVLFGGRPAASLAVITLPATPRLQGYMKNLLVAVLGGAVGAVAGAVLTYLAAVILLQFLPSDGPDARLGGAFAAFFLAIYGGIAGLIAGVVFSLMAQAGQAMAFFKGIGILAGLVVALFVAGGLVMFALQERPSRISGKLVDVEYELRLPRGHAWPPAEASPTTEKVTFYRSTPTFTRPKHQIDYPLNPYTATMEAGRWILRGRFPMEVTPTDMGLSFYIAGTAVGHFGLEDRRPEPVDLEWFPWISPSKAPLDSSFNFRYRYQFRQ